MSPILALLGVLCLLVGFVLFVVGGFRVSVVWGLVVLFLPTILSFAGGFVGAALDLVNTSWWIGVAILVSFLPWLAFMSMHWDKAKNGFLLYAAGIVFFAAALVSIDAGTKQKIAAVALASSAKSGQPLPPAISDWLGIKKPAATADQPGPAAAPGARSDAPGGAPIKPATDAASAPIAGAAAGLETEVQVTAAVVELNDRAAKLKARKESLKGSPDLLALAALTEDIRLFNERLRVVTSRQVELKMIPAPTPTPPPGPTIPPTVVIPPSTPAPPSPPRKK